MNFELFDEILSLAVIEMVRELLDEAKVGVEGSLAGRLEAWYESDCDKQGNGDVAVTAATHTVDCTEDVSEHSVVHVKLGGVKLEAVDEKHKGLDGHIHAVVCRLFLGKTTKHVRFDVTHLLWLQF